MSGREMRCKTSNRWDAETKFIILVNLIPSDFVGTIQLQIIDI